MDQRTLQVEEAKLALAQSALKASRDGLAPRGALPDKHVRSLGRRGDVLPIVGR